MLTYSKIKALLEKNNDARSVNRLARFMAISAEIKSVTQDGPISMQAFVSMYKTELNGYQKLTSVFDGIKIETLGEETVKSILSDIESMHKDLVHTLVENLDNKTFEVTGHGGVFIIPNPAGVGHGFAIQKDQHLKLATENGSTMDDKFIQIWAFDPTDDNSNYQCHGIKCLKDSNGDDFHLPGSTIAASNIPAKVFAGVKEGDTLRYQETISFDENDLVQGHIFRRKDDPETAELKFVIHWELKANQLDYRYSSFGKFEDVVARVTQ